MQEEFSLKFDKIHCFIASGYVWNIEKGAAAHATAPLLVFFSKYFYCQNKAMLHSYNAVICENQLSSSGAAATAIALRADGVCGLMLAKLLVLHMRAGTLLQAAL